MIVINSPPPPLTCSQALRVSKPFVPGDLFLPGPIRSWLTFYLCGCWFLVSCASSIFLTPKHTEEAKSARSSTHLLHLSKGHTEAGSHRFQVTAAARSRTSAASAVFPVSAAPRLQTPAPNCLVSSPPPWNVSGHMEFVICRVLHFP